MTTPFTYLIGWSHLNLFYYGVRYAQGCSPSDLWTRYFTSSKEVPKLRKLHGEPDVLQIRRTFYSASQAKAWELRVLRRMKVRLREDFINLAELPAPPGVLGHRMTDATRDKMRASHIGKKRSPAHCEAISRSRAGGQIGKMASASTRGKMQLAHSGKVQPHLETTKIKIGIAQRGMRWWSDGCSSTKAVTSPGDGWRLGRK
jgi:hypothetical protein